MKVPKPSRFLPLAVVLVLVGGFSACGDEDVDAGTMTSSPVAVLSAFPAEMAPVLEKATILETKVIEGRVFRVGRLAGVPVVITMTGIGLLNAKKTTQVLLENFAIRGIVVSAVAGSTHNIGDVTVPATWQLKDGTSFPVYQPWLQLATQIAPTVTLERCATVTYGGADQNLCMPAQPVVVVGGTGQSTDPFGSTPFACQPGGGDIYGCDSAAPAPSAASLNPRAASAETPIASDMETAAIAREAAARGVPFIAFRAVSDGGGDPLNLGGFLEQFSVYYRYVARNAATATAAFLNRLASNR